MWESDELSRINKIKKKKKGYNMITSIRPRVESKSSTYRKGDKIITDLKTMIAVYVDDKRVAHESFSFNNADKQHEFCKALEEFLDKNFQDDQSTIDIRWGSIVIYQPKQNGEQPVKSASLKTDVYLK